MIGDRAELNTTILTNGISRSSDPKRSREHGCSMMIVTSGFIKQKFSALTFKRIW
jgi:hypothetical protein